MPYVEYLTVELLGVNSAEPRLNYGSLLKNLNDFVEQYCGTNP